MDDDFVTVPNTRAGLIAELDSIATGRARMTGRPVAVVGFLNGDRLRVLELDRDEDDAGLVVTRSRVIANPREAVAHKIERTIARVLDVARRRTASGS